MKKPDFLEIQQDNKTIQMSRFISLAVGVQGLFMAALNIKSSYLLMVIVSLVYGIGMILNFIYLCFKKNLVPFYISAFLLVFVLEYTFLKSGGTEGFGIIWLTVVPLFSVYLLDTLFFYICNSVLLISLMAAMWTPLNSYIYDFNKAFEIRFPLVYAFAFLFASFLKYSIRKTEENLEIQTNLLSKEIHQAAVIQQTFYKQKIVDFPEWEIALKTIPMSEVTGDLYDIYSENEKLQGLGLFDISGHGISSGLITMLAKNIINQEFFANKNNSLDDTVNKINDHIIEVKGDIENYLTGILIRPQKDKIELVNAGHQFPIVYKAKDKSFTVLNRDPSAIGAIGIKYLPSVYIKQEIDFEQGDELILYTDGLLEYKNKQDELFGMERFLQSLRNVTDISPERQIDVITSELRLFAGKTKQTDDMTLVILKKK